MEGNKPSKRKFSKTTARRQRLYANQNGICYYCKQHILFTDWTIEHLLPRSMGGTNIADNIVGACYKCNNKRGNKLMHGRYIKFEGYRPTKIPSNNIPEIE